jgi:hypothetical protein
MQTGEIVKLLTYVNSLDARITVNEVKAMAWSKVLNPHMPFDMAIEYASTHYANSKDSVMPSDLNLMHRNARNIPRFDMGAIEAPSTTVDHEWRKIVTADLKAKIQLDKGKPYTPGGIDWEFEPGTGQYAAKAGVDVFEEKVIWDLPDLP